MKLSEVIRDNQQAIIREWESFAASLQPAAGGMSRLALRNHVEEILDAIVVDLEAPQARGEQAEKSKGRGGEHRMEVVAKAHAALRIEDGFQLTQLIAEYRALRASVLRIFEQVGHQSHAEDLRQVTRFNEALDEALVEVTTRYLVVMNRTSDQFLAILGHDLRNPLGAILMSAARMTATLAPGDKESKAAARILSSAERMHRMVNDLLDLTRTRLGSGIPIARHPMDLGELCREVLAELEAAHPRFRLAFSAAGDLRGQWDSDRLAQVLSNLVGNAVQHGEPGKPVAVRATGEADGVVVEIHNQGRPIPRVALSNIFEPMVRHVAEGTADSAPTSLGLGLYIARQIVLAHGGSMEVTSTGDGGTTFTARLPRQAGPSPHEAPQAPQAPPDTHDATGALVNPAPPLPPPGR